MLEFLNHCLERMNEQVKRLQRPLLAHVNHPLGRKAFTLRPEEIAQAGQCRFMETCNGNSGAQFESGRPVASEYRQILGRR